jgi:hypothetical protein
MTVWQAGPEADPRILVRVPQPAVGSIRRLEPTVCRDE